MFEVIVIGKGLFGASAVRHLSQTTANIAIIGPDEPTDPATHQGVFGAHYDEGRLTYQLKSDTVWANLAVASLARFPAIEAASGIQFHSPVGCLYLASRKMDNGRLSATPTTNTIPYEKLNPTQIQERFPYINVAANCLGQWEGPPAGHFSPRKFIEAQMMLANNTAVINDYAIGIEPKKDSLVVLTADNGRFKAKKVLIATGAYSNNFGLLQRPLSLQLKQEFVIRALLPEKEARRLQAMPPIVYRVDHPRLADLYILPPIRYPDGRYYLKMGANTALDQFIETAAEINGWYRTGNSNAMLAEMQEMVLDIFPGLTAESWHTHRCVITRTAHGRPYIDEVLPGRVYVAVGGNGQGAKAADEVGRLATQLVSKGQAAGEAFSAVYN